MYVKKFYPIFCILFFGVLLTAKSVDAKVNKEALNEHRSYYDDNRIYKTLYDAAGNAYLQFLLGNEDENLTIVSTPDAKKGETTLVISDTVEINGKTHRITCVGTDDLHNVGTEIFSIGTGYKKIIFGKNVEKVDAYTFERYVSLEEIEFLGKTIYVGNNAFNSCKNLMQITGSEKVDCIGQKAFSNTAITHFEISSKCHSIGDSAFSNCSNLKKLPNVFQTENIGDNLFSNCSGLTKLKIPDGATYLPDHTFSNCINLEEVYIPKSVTLIGKQVFWNSKKLKGNVTIAPKNKHYIAKDNMILNKKGDTLLSMISPAKVMVIPSYVKKAEYYWAQDCYLNDSHSKYWLQTMIIQNKNLSFYFNRSVPCWYSPEDCKQKINILYPNTRKAFAFKKLQLVTKGGRKVEEYNLSKSYTQRPYTLHPAPTRLKAKLKKGKVQVSFKKLKNAAVKKYKITYRIKKNGIYKVQKEKVVKGRRATLCSLKKGEICEVRVSAYTKQSGVWLPGKFSRTVKVRGK